jgi:hypothetical protein
VTAAAAPAAVLMPFGTAMAAAATAFAVLVRRLYRLLLALTAALVTFAVTAAAAFFLGFGMFVAHDPTPLEDYLILHSSKYHHMSSGNDNNSQYRFRQVPFARNISGLGYAIAAP